LALTNSTCEEEGVNNLVLPITNSTSRSVVKKLPARTSPYQASKRSIQQPQQPHQIVTKKILIPAWPNHNSTYHCLMITRL